MEPDEGPTAPAIRTSAHLLPTGAMVVGAALLVVLLVLEPAG